MAGTLRVFVRLRAVAVAALLAAPMAWGQAAPSAGVQMVTDVLHEMSDRAGVIFMGQVLAVRLPVGVGPASRIVEVDFRVDQAILGCRTGQQLMCCGSGAGFGLVALSAIAWASTC